MAQRSRQDSQECGGGGIVLGEFSREALALCSQRRGDGRVGCAALRQHRPHSAAAHVIQSLHLRSVQLCVVSRACSQQRCLATAAALPQSWQQGTSHWQHACHRLEKADDLRVRT